MHNTSPTLERSTRALDTLARTCTDTCSTRAQPQGGTGQRKFSLHMCLSWITLLESNGVVYLRVCACACMPQPRPPPYAPCTYHVPKERMYGWQGQPRHHVLANHHGADEGGHSCGQLHGHGSTRRRERVALHVWEPGGEEARQTQAGTVYEGRLTARTQAQHTHTQRDANPSWACASGEAQFWRPGVRESHGVGGRGRCKVPARPKEGSAGGGGSA